MKSVRTFHKIIRLAYRKSYLAILVLSTLTWPKIPCLFIFRLTYLHLPLVTYIWHSIALITFIWSHLPLIDLIWPYVTYSPWIDILLLRLILCATFYSNRNWAVQKVLTRMQFMCLSSHWHFVYVPSDALPLYQIIGQSDNWLWRYCSSNIWGIHKCCHECSCSRAWRVQISIPTYLWGISTPL